jgi:MFS family permease
MVQVFGLGVGCFAAAYALFAVNTSGVLFLGVAFAIAGIGIGLVETAEHAAVAMFAPEGIRGSAFGLLAAVQSFGNLAASAVVGILYAAVSASVAFGYAAVVMGVALVALMATSRRQT